MSNSLIVLDDPEIANLYSLNLNIFLGLDVLIKKNVYEAIALLNLIKSADVIITREKLGNENAYEQIKEWLQQNDIEIPIILLDRENKEGEETHSLNSKNDIKKNIQEIANILGINLRDSSRKIFSEFYPVPLHYFDLIKKSFCQTFRRSSKAAIEDDAVYVKLFDANELVVREKIREFKKIGIKNLYILSSARSKFAHQFTMMILEQIEKEKNKDKRFRIFEGISRVMTHELLKYGMNVKVIKLTKAMVERIYDELNKERSIMKFLHFLNAETDYYLFQKSILTLMICYKIIDNMDWGTEEQKKKITYVGLYNDIVFDDEKLARITDDEELNNAILTDDEKDLVLNHAQIASGFLTKLPETPMGVEIIIKQHHGTHNGVGFKHPPHHDISPLAAVFMVAEEIAIPLLEKNVAIDTEEILYNIEEKYPNHNKFLQAIEAAKLMTR